MLSAKHIETLKEKMNLSCKEKADLRDRCRLAFLDVYQSLLPFERQHNVQIAIVTKSEKLDVVT